MAVGVSEAAQQLGVSRQRVLQLIADRRLPADRVGRVWSINESDLARHRPPAGRPLSVSMTRGLLELAAGVRPDLSPNDLSRLRSHLIRLAREVDSGDPVVLLRSWLPRRAERLEMSVADADLAEVLADKRLLPSGVSDVRAAMSSARMGEGYVAQGAASQFFVDHFAVESDNRVRANLIVHVAGFVPPLSALLVAADLAEYRAEREDRQSAAVLRDWFTSDDYDADLLFGRSRP